MSKKELTKVTAPRWLQLAQLKRDIYSWRRNICGVKLMCLEKRTTMEIVQNSSSFYYTWKCR